MFEQKQIYIGMSINDDVLFETVQCSLTLLSYVDRMYMVNPYNDINKYLAIINLID